MASPLSVIFLGTPSVAATALKVLRRKERSHGYRIIQVVTQQPAPPRRRKKAWTKSPVHELAESMEIPIVHPSLIKHEIEALKALEPSLAITAAYGQLLPAEFLAIPTYGTYNIHPSLLPKYRGAAPVQRAIERGDTESGVTILKTIRRMDAGPILCQARHPITKDVTAAEFQEAMFECGAELLASAIPRIRDGSVKCSPQHEISVTHASKISSEEALLNFSLPAEVLHNKVRAFQPWPGTRGIFRVGSVSVEIKILSTTVLSADELCSHKVGTVLKATKQSPFLKIVCGGGSCLGILELQVVGGKRTSALAFSNGLQSKKVVVPLGK